MATETPSSTVHHPLPPSVEQAYRLKCIALKRRMNEVEEANDTLRLRKARHLRAIRKMRFERALLLDALSKRMGKNGGSVDGVQTVFDEDSDGSSEAPPTPNEKPLRSKRSHRRPASSPPPMPLQPHRPLAPSMHPTSAFDNPPRDPFRESQYQHTLPTPTSHGPVPLQFQNAPQQHPTAAHPSAIAPHPLSPPSPSKPSGRRDILDPPVSAFEDFLHKEVLRYPDRFSYSNEQEAMNIAVEAWNDPQFQSERAKFEKAYERRLKNYEKSMNALDETERQDAMEGQVQANQRLQPKEEPGTGGFTSING